MARPTPHTMPTTRPVGVEKNCPMVSSGPELRGVIARMLSLLTEGTSLTVAAWAWAMSPVAGT